MKLPRRKLNNRREGIKLPGNSPKIKEMINQLSPSVRGILLSILGSGKTTASRMSLRSQVEKKVKEEEKEKPNWDPSVKSEANKQAFEDRVASQLATEILKDNQKLKGIHSNQSVRKVLEREAKKLIQAGGGEYKGPVVSIVKDKEKKDDVDPSNLPYLHKNPAV